MSEIKITKDSLENAILKDGQLVIGDIKGRDSSIISSEIGSFAGGTDAGYPKALIKSSAQGSFTFGRSVNNSSLIASNYGAVAFGDATSHGSINSTGEGSFAGGMAYGAISQSAKIIASGNGSFAYGYAGENSSVAALATGSVAMGFEVVASEIGAHAEGYNTKAAGCGAHAEGYKTYAGIQLDAKAKAIDRYDGRNNAIVLNEGNAEFLQGKNVFINNHIYNVIYAIEDDVIEFEENISDEDLEWAKNNSILQIDNVGAHSEGCETIAVGNYSHAEGNKTTAFGTASHASGIGTIANQEAMTAIGKYNVSTNTENTLFVVGDGSIGNHSDAFRVNKIGSNTGDSSVPSSVQAKVNGVPDVYLGCPIGTVVMWAGGKINTDKWYVSTEAPDGWLVCDGRVIPTTNSSYNIVQDDYKDFQNLLNVIGTKYGTMYLDTSSLIDMLPSTVKNEQYQLNAYYVCIPDFSKKFPLGSGYTSRVGKLHLNHFKFAAGNQEYYSYNGSTGGEAGHMLTPNEITPSTRLGGNSGGDVYACDGLNTEHNNIPPFLAINFIIKYK